MKRKLAISDVHGQLTALNHLLDAAKFNPTQDQLVFLGDLIDRGPDSVGVIKFVKQLQENHPENIFVILGNHEIMLRRYIFGGSSHMWLQYGGLKVIEEMKTLFAGETDRNDHLVWLANLPLAYMDENYLYVHAGMDVSCPIHKQHEDSTFMALDTMYTVDDVVLNKAIGKRIIVHGHTPYSSVYQAGRFISCDTGASVLQNGQLSLVDVTNGLYYCNNTQSPDVTQLPIKQLDITERILTD
ncbi:metallophosphoesterase family protein [Neobacillus dielmonensis]|uniref:metallophosphoesterase family protein n=1 Tax=Neobacillus dielmonensis TaxID=1347369 RepID=UPI0005AB6486|nr:metallophosphoesterase family protein [Neobacillus dielmonensis]